MSMIVCGRRHDAIPASRIDQARISIREVRFSARRLAIANLEAGKLSMSISPYYSHWWTGCILQTFPRLLLASIVVVIIVVWVKVIIILVITVWVKVIIILVAVAIFGV